jgi:hypothetical protein
MLSRPLIRPLPHDAGKRRRQLYTETAYLANIPSEAAGRHFGQCAPLSRARADFSCNTWTARLLQAAGYPARRASALTVKTVMKRLRPYATLIQVPEK